MKSSILNSCREVEYIFLNIYPSYSMEIYKTFYLCSQLLNIGKK